MMLSRLCNDVEALIGEGDGACQGRAGIAGKEGCHGASLLDRHQVVGRGAFPYPVQQFVEPVDPGSRARLDGTSR